MITLLLLLMGQAQPSTPKPLDFIRIAADKSSFETDGKPWRPMGFNYDHDDAGVLLEDYWDRDWDRVRGDFAEMKALGANAARIHLQLGKFLDGPTTPNRAAMAKLRLLCQLASQIGIRLNLTGLGCYHKKDVPQWYDALDEKGRWDAHATFWKTIAREIKEEPIVFCLDLMNEPVVTGEKRQPGDWLGPPFAGKHFVQHITLDQANRPRFEIAKAWIDQLVKVIRAENNKHLITVGLVDWSLDRPGLTSGFIPEKCCQNLDFISVHLYPKQGKMAEARETLLGFKMGKPVVLEETFALACSAKDLGQFLQSNQADLGGVFTFYWGKPIEQLKASKTIGDAILSEWLTEFRALTLNQK